MIAAIGQAPPPGAAPAPSSAAAASSIPTHIPYRESKLTWLLAPSLGGGAKVLMLVAASPAADQAGETLCSLRFAAKVNATEVGTARRVVRGGG